MKTRILVAALVSVFVFSLFAAENNSETDKNWTNWRGPNFNGVAAGGNPPAEWSDPHRRPGALREDDHGLRQSAGVG